MNDPFFSLLNPIIHRINSIHSRRMTAYVHCSKINNCIQALKQIPPIIYEAQLQFPHRPVTDVHLNRIRELTIIFSKLEDLFIQCCSTNCFQFLLSSSIGDVKQEMKRLRDTSSVLFDQIEIPQASLVMQISEEEINKQDFVDMKRVAQMLMKLSQQKRKDAEPNLLKRFHSLAQLGISTTQIDTENISIPRLPSNLQITFTHNDIELGREIGMGQTGVVKVGVIKSVQQTVAVKIIMRKILTSQELESFRREIYTLSVLDHANLLRFFGYTQEAPFYIITEYLSHGSLYDVLHKSSLTLTPTRRSIIAADVAQGLCYLHSQGIIHRDMKTLNVLLDDHYRAKICDFGMARTRTSGQQPMTGLIGTAHWMAPEVLMSSPTYNEKVDVYSFGVMLWELLTGKVPYGDMNTANIAIYVVEQGLRPPLPESTPLKMRELITKCWNVDPLKRPSMAEVMADLMTPDCHFPHTNEVRFKEAERSILEPQRSQIKRHSSVNSKRPPSIDGLDPAGLVATLEMSTDIENLKGLMDILESKKMAELAAAAGACAIIAKVLEGRKKGTTHLIEKLAKCNTHQIFDVPVIKALLSFADEKRQSLREKALAALIVASELRIDFLKSYPSFLPMLLGFIKEPLTVKIANDFLTVVWKLLVVSVTYPDNIIQILMWVIDRSEITDMIVSCVVAAMRFEEALNEFTKDQFVFVLRNVDKCGPISDAFISSEKSSKNDELFVKLLFKGRSNKKIAEYILKISSEKRFVNYVIANLPLNDENALFYTSNIYLALYEYFQTIEQTPIPKFVHFPEFYNIASYLITNKSYDPICNILRNLEIDSTAVSSTKLSAILAEEIEHNNEPDKLLILMGASFAILKVYQANEFVGSIPRFESFLFSDQQNKILRMPSFLCLSAISNFSPNGIDYGKLVPAAAFFVNVGSKLMRDVAALILHDHISDNDINLNYVFQVFVDNFNESIIDDNVKVAIAAFTSVCTRPEISEELLQKMSQIYLRIQQQ